MESEALVRMGLLFGQDVRDNPYLDLARPAIMILPRTPAPGTDGSLGYYVPHFSRLVRWRGSLQTTSTPSYWLFGLQVRGGFFRGEGTCTQVGCCARVPVYLCVVCACVCVCVLCACVCVCVLCS